jgi:hypothetical protein
MKSRFQLLIQKIKSYLFFFQIPVGGGVGLFVGGLNIHFVVAFLLFLRDRPLVDGLNRFESGLIGFFDGKKWVFVGEQDGVPLQPWKGRVRRERQRLVVDEVHGHPRDGQGDVLAIGYSGRGDDGLRLGIGFGLLGGPHHGAGQEALPRAAVEHRLDVLPRVSHLLGGVAAQLHVPPPRVEVGGVGLDVLVGGAEPVRVEDEFVGREKQTAHRTLYAFRPRGVVPRGQERTPAAPSALVVHGEGEVVGQPRGRVVPQEALAEALGLPSGDHAATARRHRHGPRSPEDLQLDGGALHTRYP